MATKKPKPKQKPKPKPKQKPKSNKKNIFIILGIIFCLACLVTYNAILRPSIHTPNGTDTYLFAVPTGSTYESLTQKLRNELNMSNSRSFLLLADFVMKNPPSPGLYKLHNRMSNKDLLILFRSGVREYVNFTISFARYAKDVTAQAVKQLEASQEDFDALFADKQFLDSLGVNKNTIITLFIPDTYQFKWNTSARQFMERMHKEYTIFWNEERLAKAQKLGLTPKQVMTLASIINQETNKNDEKPRIAGVLFNRLRKGQKLEVDPTIKFAINDFSIKRVVEKHKDAAGNSPYNTYRHTGIPPGPICTPQKVDIDAVLNPEKHDYYFYCAKINSNHHQFTRTFNEHVNYANTYRAWLDKINIK
ncbi:MAG: endolytic transglycosylase MltG [Bacteroidetes bacterium]|nr:endolytic transglycosylase MltG [Bacteroidota bacterium]